MVVGNVVVYSMVVLLGARDLTAAITGSHMGTTIDFGAILGEIFLE
jgi:hypothetical protein